ncbi:glycosyltransferase family 2 protein [Pedobacter gandavensis]|uniref:glycosyltransferase family 2 protein n=1 Tax=Pedobacter gandavensis TaxID=2679963 RepID=UPI00247B0419|nr:glycosyltransferase family 2 protein [Pedobacter gandavensis]WGQ07515.1 glycosyltransferase family 2 protein [Pedobacter gandavensis]
MFRNTKKIAILLAAYNADKYLEEQIESVLSQTFQEWTLYIRNDGSNDNTSKIIDNYCNIYPNIVEIDKGGVNLGCRNNFFRLLEVVDSDYYMFCDADDVWFENKIELSINRMREIELLHLNKPLLVHTDTAIYDQNLNLIAESFWKTANINPDRFLTFNLLCVSFCVGGSTMLFNKQVKDLVIPLEDNDLIYDYWIAINVVKHGVISTIHQPTTKYRQHDSNVCGVTLGEENSFYNKIKNWKSLLIKYKHESDVLKTIGYGSFGKYLFYKSLVIIKRKMYKQN